MTQAQSPKPKAQEPTPMQVITGVADVTVTFADGHREDVLVRLVPIRQFPKYLDLQMDEPAMVEFLCDRPTGWADTLEFESLERIVAAGDVLNADFFGRWLRRRLDRQERLLPGSLGGASAPPPAEPWPTLSRTSQPPLEHRSGTSPT